MNSCKKKERSDVKLGVAILRAAKEDIERGLLNEWTILISAEVFDDLLEQAEHLLDNGYKDPAASLIGAVLEKKLRLMCEESDIPVSDKDNIGSLNQKLFQNNTFSKPQMRQVAHWQSIRDSADHGKFEDYKTENVKNMLEGVRNFLASQLT
jgi:hypothetical protein